MLFSYLSEQLKSNNAHKKQQPPFSFEKIKGANKFQ